MGVLDRMKSLFLSAPAPKKGIVFKEVVSEPASTLQTQEFKDTSEPASQNDRQKNFVESSPDQNTFSKNPQEESNKLNNQQKLEPPAKLTYKPNEIIPMNSPFIYQQRNLKSAERFFEQKDYNMATKIYERLINNIHSRMIRNKLKVNLDDIKKNNEHQSNKEGTPNSEGENQQDNLDSSFANQIVQHIAQSVMEVREAKFQSQQIEAHTTKEISTRKQVQEKTDGATSQPAGAPRDGASSQPAGAPRDGASSQPAGAPRDGATSRPAGAPRDGATSQPGGAPRDDANSQFTGGAPRDDASSQFTGGAPRDDATSRPAGAPRDDATSQPAGAPRDDASSQPAGSAPSDGATSQLGGAPRDDATSQPAGSAPSDGSISQPAGSAPSDGSISQPAGSAPSDGSISQPAGSAPRDSTKEIVKQEQEGKDLNQQPTANKDASHKLKAEASHMEATAKIEKKSKSVEIDEATDEDDDLGDSEQTSTPDKTSPPIHGVFDIRPPELEDSASLTLTYDFTQIPYNFPLSKDNQIFEYSYYKYKPMLVKAHKFIKSKQIAKALNFYKTINDQEIPYELKSMITKNMEDINEFMTKYFS